MEINGNHYVNYRDYYENFWNNNYSITVDGIKFIANADNAQDAIDYLVDYCEWFMPGLIMTQDEVDEEEFLDDYICGGNHGRYINTPEVYIEKI